MILFLDRLIVETAELQYLTSLTHEIAKHKFPYNCRSNLKGFANYNFVAI